MPSLRRRAISLGLGGSLLLAAAGCNRSSREPIKFATNPWPGYDPLYVARDKGYFDEVGLDVTLVDLTSLGASRRAFERGQVDGCGATLVEILLTADQSGTRPQIAAVVDYSNGADVLVGEARIAGPAGLRERRVAIEPGTLHIQLRRQFTHQRGRLSAMQLFRQRMPGSYEFFGFVCHTALS